MPIRRLSLQRESLTQLTPEDLRGIAGAYAISDGHTRCTVVDDSYRVWALECTSNTWMCTGGC